METGILDIEYVYAPDLKYWIKEMPVVNTDNIAKEQSIYVYGC